MGFNAPVPVHCLLVISIERSNMSDSLLIGKHSIPKPVVVVVRLYIRFKQNLAKSKQRLGTEAIRTQNKT